MDHTTPRGGYRFRVSTLRRRGTLASVVIALLASAGAPTAAQANHDNPTALCNSKFEGSFTQIGTLPLYRNGPGTTQVGYVSINGQRQDGRSKYRVCSVTIRRWHGEAKDTWAYVQRSGAYYRIDRGPFFRYAGPVVGAMRRGQEINGGGRVSGACASYRVRLPASGGPTIDGGGCS